MIFLPLAIAYAYRLFQNNKTIKLIDYAPAVLALSATASGHLGIGLLTFISIAVLALPDFWRNIKKLNLLYGGAG